MFIFYRKLLPFCMLMCTTISYGSENTYENPDKTYEQEDNYRKEDKKQLGTRKIIWLAINWKQRTDLCCALEKRWQIPSLEECIRNPSFFVEAQQSWLSLQETLLFNRVHKKRKQLPKTALCPQPKPIIAGKKRKKVQEPAQKEPDKRSKSILTRQDGIRYELRARTLGARLKK